MPSPEDLIGAFLRPDNGHSGSMEPEFIGSAVDKRPLERGISDDEVIRLSKRYRVGDPDDVPETILSWFTRSHVGGLGGMTTARMLMLGHMPYELIVTLCRVGSEPGKENWVLHQICERDPTFWAELATRDGLSGTIHRDTEDVTEHDLMEEGIFGEIPEKPHWRDPKKHDQLRNRIISTQRRKAYDLLHVQQWLASLQGAGASIRVKSTNSSATREVGVVSIGRLMTMVQLHISNRSDLPLGFTVPSSIGSLTRLKLFTAYGGKYMQSIDDDDKGRVLVNVHLPQSMGELAELVAIELINVDLEEIPIVVARMKSLAILVISHAQIRSIPGFIATIPGLVEFHLENSLLMEIPPFMGTMSTLTRMSLNANEIREIPDEIRSMVGLAYLDLSHNRLTSIPNSIGSLDRLKYLDVSDNEIRGVSSALGDLVSLEILAMGNNLLTEHVFYPIGRLPRLEEIDLHGNRITRIIGPIRSSWTSLDLHDNLLTNLSGVVVEERSGHVSIEVDGNPLNFDTQGSPGGPGASWVRVTMVMRT